MESESFDARLKRLDPDVDDREVCDTSLDGAGLDGEAPGRGDDSDSVQGDCKSANLPSRIGANCDR